MVSYLGSDSLAVISSGKLLLGTYLALQQKCYFHNCTLEQGYTFSNQILLSYRQSSGQDPPHYGSKHIVLSLIIIFTVKMYNLLYLNGSRKTKIKFDTIWKYTSSISKLYVSMKTEEAKARLIREKNNSD